MSCDNIILLSVILLCLLYGTLISYFSVGWFLLKEFKCSANIQPVKVSVIVPVRNEEENIQNLLDKLIAQDYPVDFFEVLVLDDASDDDSVFRVKEFLASNPEVLNIKLIEVTDKEAKGKKAMISKGVEIASGNLIITTDADCQMKEKWISTIVDFYNKNQSKLIIGPVCFKKEKSFFSKIQDLEFFSLIATAAGSIQMKTPIMCNGANLAFEKSLFDDIMPFAKNFKIASGDDQFLLIETRKKFNEKIHFLKSRDAVVYTYSKNSILEFVNQRIRWTSKSVYYNDIWLYFVSVVVFFFNFICLFSPVFSAFFPEYFFYSLILVGFKMIIDFPILFGICSFFDRKKLLLYYLPTQIFVIIYTSFIGIAGNLIKVKWKGRKI